nr:hypothetical protein [Desulfobulbaceae bacterium]
MQGIIGFSLSLPLPIIFAAPPELIVLPGTNIYVDPDVNAEIYFYSGYDRDRRLQGVFAAARDITEMKQAEKQI